MSEAFQYILVFSLGYLLARLNDVRSMSWDGADRPRSFFDNNKPEKKKAKVDIDESTYVTEVSTDTLQKSFSEIGKTTSTQDSVDSSVSKLAKLKKR